MGYNATVYVGPYVKVYLPIVDNTYSMKTCPSTDCQNYGKYIGTKFCDKCGAEIKDTSVTKKGSLNIHYALQGRIHEDTFFAATQEWLGSKEPKDFVLLLPNNKAQGGYDIDEHEYGMFEFTDLNVDQFQHEDWDKLINVLTELKLAFEKKISIVRYYH